MIRQTTTYCRLCEATCGLIATVEGDRLTRVHPNPEHVLSQGFCCIKAQGAVDITYDPDRVVQPLRRVGGPGVFEPCSWEDALSDIASRLTDIRARHGPESVAALFGNPAYFGYGCAFYFPIFMKALGIKYCYQINSEDGASRMVASHFLYGSPAILPKPDLWRTSFAIVIGANPIVSRGSLVCEPKMREALDSIVERGGRVIVIDPRFTETAKHYEHIFVRPGTDGWLLAGMARVILDESLENREFLSKHTSGLNGFRAALEQFDLQTCATRCGIEAVTIQALARALATAPSGLIYGRVGTCTQRFGTLVNFLQDAVVALTGNIDREGGLLAGWAPVDFGALAKQAGVDGYARWHSRIDKLPECYGLLPSGALVRDSTVPGDDRVRALISIASNAVLSSGAGGGPRMEEALSQLDLHVSIDLYVNETNRFADYVLPSTTMYERDDFHTIGQGNMLRPALWVTRAVIPPRGEAREESDILLDLARRLGIADAFMHHGVVLTPEMILDGLFSGSERPDLTFEKLHNEHPHGLQLRADLPAGNLLDRLSTPGGVIPLDAPEILNELGAMHRHQECVDYPVRLIGMREPKSQNSWMHNIRRLQPRHGFGARINPVDAELAGIKAGGNCRITSKAGSIDVPVILTEDVQPGTIALPHGWGHKGGWRSANAISGANFNILVSGDLEDIESLAGMSILTGTPVKLSALGEQEINVT